MFISQINVISTFSIKTNINFKKDINLIIYMISFYYLCHVNRRNARYNT